MIFPTFVGSELTCKLQRKKKGEMFLRKSFFKHAEKYFSEKFFFSKNVWKKIFFQKNFFPVFFCVCVGGVNYCSTSGIILLKNRGEKKIMSLKTYTLFDLAKKKFFSVGRNFCIRVWWCKSKVYVSFYRFYRRSRVLDITFTPPPPPRTDVLSKILRPWRRSFGGGGF